ncbi:hypothetical protein AB0H76_04505 [Nocardia sp. NPDC050712]|uniref:hypothetical protein n=1 Tax=Nocardia sp. NPDC050712 TaxID=3155518 RepID=UPI0033E9FBD9
MNSTSPDEPTLNALTVTVPTNFPNPGWKIDDFGSLIQNPGPVAFAVRDPLSPVSTFRQYSVTSSVHDPTPVMFVLTVHEAKFGYTGPLADDSTTAKRSPSASG